MQRKQRGGQRFPGFIFLFSPHLLVVPISVSVNQFKLLMHHETEYAPLHSGPPNCPLQYWSVLELYYSFLLVIILFLFFASFFEMCPPVSGFSSCLLWELRSHKELGGVSTVRMRSSLGQETKGGRCVTFLSHLRHSITTDWEVEDISDKEERSLKGLKTVFFLPAGRISKTKEKRSFTCTSKKY